MTVPIVLMGYLNPLLAFGVEKLAETSAEVGVDGFIVVDLPPEEVGSHKTTPFKDSIDSCCE